MPERTGRRTMRRLPWLVLLPCLQAAAAPRDGLVLAPPTRTAALRLEGGAGCHRPALRLEGEASGRALRGSPRVDASLGRLIGEAAADHGLDAALVKAVVRVESAFDPAAVSHKGAMGLMQLMPATAAGLGVTDPARALLDPSTNLRAGARHLRALRDRFPDRLDLALAAYNAGEGAVMRWAGVPPYPETQQYVSAVLGWYDTYRDGDTDAPAPVRSCS